LNWLKDRLGLVTSSIVLPAFFGYRKLRKIAKLGMTDVLCFCEDAVFDSVKAMPLLSLSLQHLVAKVGLNQKRGQRQVSNQ